MADDDNVNENLNNGMDSSEPQSSPPVEPFGSGVPTPPPSPYSQPTPPPPSEGFPPPPPVPPQMGTYYSNQEGFSASGAKNDPFATTSMVTGIVGVPFLCCWPIALILAIIATVFGALSMNKIKKANGALGGKGMAIAGLVLGISVIAISIILLIIGILSDSTNFSYYSN